VLTHAAMALNALTGGHELVVYDINRDAGGLYLEASAAWADTDVDSP
jgi:hypothetical protein